MTPTTPRVLNHYTYNRQMAFVMEDETLRKQFFAMKPKLKEYLGSLQPPYLTKGLPGMYTMGRDFEVQPSDYNPLVIVLIVATDDIPRLYKEIDETILGLIRQYFEIPVPPFRLYARNTGPLSLLGA